MGTHFEAASRRLAGAILAFGLLAGSTANLTAQALCRPQVMQGEVQAGQAWEQPISSTLDLKIEAVPAGWMVRVLPRSGERPPHDAAELANPPYRSPTPILISTDFAFRAQDAIAWNPRTFRFFTSAAQTAEAERIYQATLRHPNDTAAVNALATLLSSAPEARLTILDAVIVAGTANQSAAAGTVASHFDQTAHSIRNDMAASPLGRLLALRFRVTLPALGPGCGEPGRP